MKPTIRQVRDELLGYAFALDEQGGDDHSAELRALAASLEDYVLVPMPKGWGHNQSGIDLFYDAGTAAEVNAMFHAMLPEAE